MTAIHLARPDAGADLLLRRDELGVATLTLNRPAQFNALSLGV